MRKSLSNIIINLLIVYIILHTLVFYFLHFYTPQLGSMHFQIVPSNDNPEICYVTIDVENASDEYYLLIYEENKSEQWIYSASTTYSADSSHILSEFLPENKSKYILLSGYQEKQSFTITLKSKYAINAMSTMDHIFHIYYVDPIDLFPSTFYFNYHSVFFVEPLI